MSEPICPRCHRAYPLGDPRSVVPGRQCFDCDANFGRFSPTASQPSPKPELADLGNRSAGPATRWRVLSPDGVPITPGDFASSHAADLALTHWIRRFDIQGYYAAASGRRIPLGELAAACTRVAVHPRRRRGTRS